MGRKRVIYIQSSDEMIQLGKQISSQLVPNTVLALFGDLGAGKTTFVQGLAQGLGIEVPIQSPTFVYLNEYQGVYPLFHFDLYRMKTADDFIGLGFDEYLTADGITAIEWPERILPMLTEKIWTLHFSHEGRQRKILFSDHFTMDFEQSVI